MPVLPACLVAQVTGRRRWKDLTPTQRAALLVAGSVQLGLAGFAWSDLARRPPAAVNGPRPLWAALIGIDFVGPIAYLRWGRRSGVGG